MYSNADLTQHLQQSSVIQSKSKVIAEWNLNIFENIDVIGNYFYRPSASSLAANPTYLNLTSTFVKETENTSIKYYYGGTDYDTVLDGIYDNDGLTPITFLSQNNRQKSLMSLEDCFKRFRPRSGINKWRYFADKKLPLSNENMYGRPRYYVADSQDNFKYWSAAKQIVNPANSTELVNLGVSYNVSGSYFIDDAAPFVKYKNKIPANRIVLKVQTNVGSINEGSFRTAENKVYDDPFYSGSAVNYKSTPLVWKLEKLDEANNWITIYEITSGSPSDVFPVDGYVELAYGITNIPFQYQDNFKLLGTASSTYSLPNLSSEQEGSAYILKSTESSVGSLYIWNKTSWDSPITPTYGWYLNTQTQNNTQQYISNLSLSSAPNFKSGSNTIYREFDYINGIRFSVTKMLNNNSALDLIELSPRLAADITDYTIGYSIKKSASDIGITGIPVGQLLASTGQISLFDYNQVFNENNTQSLLNVYSDEAKTELLLSFVSKNLQLKFYETISQVPSTGNVFKDYTIPIKTMYSDGFPQYNNANREINLNLRDLFFYFESIMAPELMMQNKPLSVIIATLLDNIGFSNYIFKRGLDTSGNVESDPVIPYFFVPPSKTIVQVLNDLAQSTQTAMFFDEDNNFVCMTKGFLVPESTAVRTTDITLYGNDITTSNKPNIIDIKSENNDIYNDGKVVYRNRYVQKEVSSLTQVSQLDKDRRWRYKPVLLWEVSGEESTKSINEQLSTQSNYTLSAIPLAADITSELPYVDVNGNIRNNIIEFGDGVYYLSRYNGYFYANGEIIKYDAVEYNVTGTGNVWIQSVEEYQRYFANIPFAGQMYPTGRIRIYVEPYYTSSGLIDKTKPYKDTLSVPVSFVGATTTSSANSQLGIRENSKPTDRGAIFKHGRGQFGTKITNHYASISSNATWKKDNIYSVATDSQYLFKKDSTISATTSIPVSSITSKTGTVNTTIKNYLGEAKYNVKTGKYDLINDSIQASALVFNGTTFTDAKNAQSSINLIVSDLSQFASKFDTFGSRLRIIGTQKSNNTLQSPSGSFDLYSVTDTNKSKPSSIGGSSGGICFFVDKEQQGYYYEIVALTDSNPSTATATSADGIYNMFFYKMVKYEFKKAGNVSGNATSTTLEATSNSSIKSIEGFEDATLGSYVYLSGQTTTSQNGYYVVTNVGASGVSGSKWKLQKTNGLLKPISLYDGFLPIVVDDGLFTGQGRSSDEKTPTVYDIAIQVEKNLNNDKSRTFYVMFNNNTIGTAIDRDPLPMIQNIGTFIRGSSKLMFENIFAINTSVDNSDIIQNINSIFTTPQTNLDMNKYALSGIVQSTFLNSIGSSEDTKSLYYEEFGTIMREMSYFNIRFDKAYPALFSMIAPTFSSKGYIVSDYKSNAYGAEFLIFNATDTLLKLDATSGNYLRILGVSFTQESTHDLTVDEYYSKQSDLSNYDGVIEGTSPSTYKQQYIDIKNNRITYGTKSFTIDSPYIQNYDTAYNIMDWVINKLKKPRKSIGVDIFGLPILQLGDIVQISHKSTDSGITEINPSSKFVVYSIDHTKDGTGLSSLIYLSEVV